MRVLLLRTWIKNIGNGFIDKGAKAVVRQAFPNAEILEVSGHPNYVDEVEPDTYVAPMVRRALPDPALEIVKTMRSFISEESSKGNDNLEDKYFEPCVEGNMINISELVHADVAVLPGCVLYPHVFDKYIDTLIKLKNRSIPIVLLGAGGGDYSESTIKVTRQVLEYIEPVALLTRDSQAYECYNDIVDFTYDGIDCAFFIDDWYTPPEANQEFIAATFDKNEEPKLAEGCRVIRPNHSPFPVYGNSTPKEYYKIDNTMVSDSIQDYLFVYANAHETHSDRIHACLPSLVYGNQARFYYSTPRASLFDRVLQKDISEGLVEIDKENLRSEKSKQVSKLKAAINMVV